MGKQGYMNIYFHVLYRYFDDMLVKLTNVLYFSVSTEAPEIGVGIDDMNIFRGAPP